jgi:hypothetical protein
MAVGLEFKKCLFDTVLFVKNFVYTQIIQLNFKMAPIQDGCFLR